MSSSRRAVRLIAIVIVAAGLVWAIVLTAFGGIDAVIAGRKITSNEPLRPLALAAIGFTLFAFVNGVHRTYRQLSAVGHLAGERRIIAALAIGTFALGARYATTAAIGLTPYSVVSEAELWRDGHVKQPMPWAAQVPWPAKLWTFTPVGYGPTANQEEWTIVPAASPGLPLMMAAAKRLGGQCALFLVVPLFGAITVIATYSLGRRAGWPWAGVVGAWLTATSPAFLGHLMLPTAEVAVTGAAMIVAFVLLGRGLASIITAGLCLSAAILIQPDVAPLGGIGVVWLLLRGWSDRSRTLTRRVRDASVFAAFATPGVLAAAFLEQYLYGAPVAPADPSLIGSLSWSHPLLWPWLALGAGALVVLVGKSRREGLVLVAVGAVVWCGLYDLRLAARQGAFDRWRTDRASVAAALSVRDRTDANAVVFSLANSGTLRYYAGRTTLRWDLLDNRWLDRAVTWLSDRHIHAYALLDRAEVEAFRARFAGEATVKLLDTPQAVYPEITTLRFYDLDPSSARSAVPEPVGESERDSLRSVPPAAPPRLVVPR